jgi:hypothetical protein
VVCHSISTKSLAHESARRSNKPATTQGTQQHVDFVAFGPIPESHNIRLTNIKQDALCGVFDAEDSPSSGISAGGNGNYLAVPQDCQRHSVVECLEFSDSLFHLMKRNDLVPLAILGNGIGV